MKKYVDCLLDCKKALINLYAECVDMSNIHFQYNIFLSCVLSRALSVNKGYIALTKSNNYFCAVAMLRMQIENCTRLYGMTLFDAVCPNNIFGEVLNQFYGGERCQRTLRMLNRE